MQDVIKLLNSRWTQEDFFTISDTALIANGLDGIFNTIEEFQVYAEEIFRLFHNETNKARNGKASEMKLQPYSKLSEFNLAWMEWTNINYDYISFEKINELNELTLNELHDLKMQVKKHTSLLDKLTISGKLGDEYIEQLSSITKKYLDVWLIESINENHLSKSLTGDFHVVEVKPIDIAASNTTPNIGNQNLQNTIENKANEPISIHNSTIPKNSKSSDKPKPRYIGLISELMYIILKGKKAVTDIKTREDIKNCILKKMQSYKYKETKPLGLSKRSIEECFSEVNIYRGTYPLPQFS